MKLIEQLLREAGAPDGGWFTIVPKYCGYFKQVKRVEEYTPQSIKLRVCGKIFRITGEGLTIGKYFQQDLLIYGDISGVQLD